VQVSATSWRTSLQLHRVSALLWGKVLEAKLDALKANFDPNQPRVPDREMCRSCVRLLPLIGLELGNPTVTFTSPSGRVRTMRDGSWIR